MAIDDSTERPVEFLLSWRPSRTVFKKPEHVAGVLKCFGLQRRPALRRIVQELDRVVIDYRVARKKRSPKFKEADPILKRFQNSLLKVKKQWLDELRPLHEAIIALRIKMIPQSERKQKARLAMASINLDLVATTMLHIAGELRDPKVYAEAHYQPGGKSVERVFLWEPLLHLMEKLQVKPGQHGSFLGAVKSLHLALGIDPPSEGAVKKMLHDLRQSERSKQAKGYATTKKRPNA
jgi:hypothetical protein